MAAQVDKIVGRGAPEDFVEKLEELANAHHDDLAVDVIRAYFFGARFIVEVPTLFDAPPPSATGSSATRCRPPSRRGAWNERVGVVRSLHPEAE